MKILYVKLNLSQSTPKKLQFYLLFVTLLEQIFS